MNQMFHLNCLDFISNVKRQVTQQKGYVFTGEDHKWLGGPVPRPFSERDFFV